MRGFRIHELAKWVNWWPDLAVHEGPFWKDGYFTIEDKPGLESKSSLTLLNEAMNFASVRP